jgi:hypothetical protein
MESELPRFLELHPGDIGDNVALRYVSSDLMVIIVRHCPPAVQTELIPHNYIRIV